MKAQVILKSQAPLILTALTVFLVGWWFGVPSGKSDASSSGSDGEVWTCSMHPQIRQPNPGICPICNMDLIPLQDDSDGGLRELSVTSEAAALLDLRVSPVIREHAEAKIQLFGRIAYDERKLSNITARMSGRIDRLYVDFTGVSIRKGNHLAEIYSPDLYVAQRELIEAKRGLRSLGKNASPASRQTRQSIYNGIREKLRLLQLTEEQILAIENQDAPTDHITLNSPQDGIVVSKLANEGQYVKTGDPLVAIADLSTVWLNLDAYESDLPWIQYAQDVEFVVAALPGRTFHGRIAFIARDVDPLRRVAKVRVTVPNEELELKPGMFARAIVRSSIGTGNRIVDPLLAGKWISPMHPEIVRDGPGQCDICGMDLVPAEELGIAGISDAPAGPKPLLVPASAILHTGERAVTYVRLSGSPDPRFEGREIVLGPKVGEHFVVESGLSEGELVVTKGAFKLDSELQIKARPSMMSRNAGLSETPAFESEQNLRGQWGFIPRALGQLAHFASQKDSDSMNRTIAEMKAAIVAVNTESFHPKTLRDWHEFSNRLLNSLTLVQETVPANSGIAYRKVRVAVAESGRYLGLPYEANRPQVEPPEDQLMTLKEALKAYHPFAKALADDDEVKALAARDALKPFIAGLELPGDALSNATDIAALRKALEPLSEALIAKASTIGLDRVGNLYISHCPMAFNDKGANWLSQNPAILNPYFGDEMLTCGFLMNQLSFEPKSFVKESPEAVEKHQHKH